MSESGSPPAGAKSRRMSRTIASGLHTLSEHSCRPIGGVRCLPAGVRDRSGHRCVQCRCAPGQSRVVFISGAVSVALGYFAFRDFNNGAAVWMLAIWIGVGFIFQGVSRRQLHAPKGIGTSRNSSRAGCCARIKSTIPPAG
jgi:hypothetical protein